MKVIDDKSLNKPSDLFKRVNDLINQYKPEVGCRLRKKLENKQKYMKDDNDSIRRALQMICTDFGEEVAR